MLLFRMLNAVIFKLNNISRGKSLDVRGILIVKNNGTIQIGDEVSINSSPIRNVIGGDTRTSFVVKKGATLKIGNNVKISNSAFYANNLIELEENVMIGGNCKLWDSDFHPIDPTIRLNTPNEEFVSRPIKIRKNAFIGGSSIILKGVTIGKNSVLGAGSVLSKSIPDNEIWAGNPASFIKKVN